MWNLTPINTWCRCFTDGMRCWIWVTFEVVGWYINIRECLDTSVWNRWSNTLDWWNPSIHFVFWFNDLCNKAVGFITHLAMRRGWPSLRLLPLLTDHNLYWFFACQYWHRSMILHIPNRWHLPTATTCRRHHGHWYTSPSGQMTKWYIRSQEFDVHNGLTPPIATCSVPVHYLLDWSSILVSPSSLLSSSAQDEEGNLINFSYIQYQRDLELSPAFPDADGVSNTLFSDKAMHERGYPFGPTSRGVRIWEFQHEISDWFERIY